jgi:hypothetical protein
MKYFARLVTSNLLNGCCDKYLVEGKKRQNGDGKQTCCSADDKTGGRHSFWVVFE